MKLQIDRTLVVILGALALGWLLPVRGQAADVFDTGLKVAIFVLFFGYGARLSAAETKAGVRNWRLHLVILVTTFIVFPLVALPVMLIPDAVLSEPMRIGLIFLCLVPSTVQSSITFTSLAGGNIPAAMVAATASNVLGVVITPLLAIVFISSAGSGSIGFGQVGAVLVQLLLPFVLGQASRIVTASFMDRHKGRLKLLDQAVISLVVYGAFSDLRVSGVWRDLHLNDVIVGVPLILGLLAGMFLLTWHASGWLGFPRPDRIAIMFCGTKKSLATGVPMASVLFAGPVVGVLVIPLMLFHQVQLLVSSVVATRLRNQSRDVD